MYNVVLFSGVQQSDSVICLCVCVCIYIWEKNRFFSV